MGWQLLEVLFLLFQLSQRNRKQGHQLTVRLGKEVWTVRGEWSWYEIISEDGVTLNGLVLKNVFRI